jgi:hypothetical protein
MERGYYDDTQKNLAFHCWIIIDLSRCIQHIKYILMFSTWIIEIIYMCQNTIC